MTLYTVKILGVRIISTSTSSVLREIVDFKENSLVVFTPNPEFLVEASRNSEFKDILNKADINIPDGIGLVWASRFLGKPIRERVSGADLVEKLLEVGNAEKWEVRGEKWRVGSERWTIGIAGARRDDRFEEEELIKRLQLKYSGIDFVNLKDLKIKNLKFEIILACHGMVKQEKWIMENKEKINAKIFMGSGGSLDFLAGFSQRAPVWMREFGLEWLWRGLQKQGHFRRIWKAVVVFGWLVVKEVWQNARRKT